MFRTMNMGQKYSSQEYKPIENHLRTRLFQLQQECAKHKISVLITIAGEECTGRGEVINTLSSWLDAKKVRNHVFWRTSEEERLRPDVWRYWRNLPGYGEFGIFLGGWYGEHIRQAAYGQLDDVNLAANISRRVSLERTLADNDYVIAKFWLHISEDEHKKRCLAYKKTKGVYSFTPHEKKAEKSYPQLVEAAAKVVTQSDTNFGPWHIIDAYNKEFRNASVGRALIETIEQALAQKIQREGLRAPEAISTKESYISVLDRVNFSLSLSKDAYKAQLKELQTEVYKLSSKAYHEGISSTLVFEGGDAAGKGGAIRRLSAAVDARITRIIPISAPSDEELAHHYLWRFWRHVPMAGHVTMYDRSWYGRVLVERVEGFATQEAWSRAYTEIKDFEEQLVDGKNILLKFWIHTSSEEQLRRFKEREAVPWKQYKITDEDWRNREKAHEYNRAADEMFMRTDTEYAPWNIISGESKYHARIEVLTIYRNALRKALGMQSDKLNDEDVERGNDLKSVASTMKEQKTKKRTKESLEQASQPNGKKRGGKKE